MQETPSFRFRVGVELWSKTHRGFWSWGACIITPESITMCALLCQHLHRPGDLVELRWCIRTLGVSFVAISVQEGKPLYSDAEMMFRGRRMRAALEACGYAFTSETRGFSWRQASQDIARYGLINPN